MDEELSPLDYLIPTGTDLFKFTISHACNLSNTHVSEQVYTPKKQLCVGDSNVDEKHAFDPNTHLLASLSRRLPSSLLLTILWHTHIVLRVEIEKQFTDTFMFECIRCTSVPFSLAFQHNYSFWRESLMFYFCIFQWAGGRDGIPNLTCGLKIYSFPRRLSVFVVVLSSVMCKLVIAAHGYSGQGLCDLPGGVFMCREHFSPCSFLLLLGLCYFGPQSSATQKNLWIQIKFFKKMTCWTKNVFHPHLDL